MMGTLCWQLYENRTTRPCSPVVLSQVSSSVLAGQAECAEVTWRGLYACSNGWRGLRPGCFEALELGSSPDFCFKDYPRYRILDARDLGWTAAAGSASELLVLVDWTSVQVTLRARPPHGRPALQTGTLMDGKVHLPAGARVRDEAAAAEAQLCGAWL